MTPKRTTPLKQTDIKGHHCPPDVRLEKLGMVSFFQGVYRDELTDINKLFNSRHYEKGDSVYHQGEEASWLRVVVFGAVKLMHHTPEGKDILIDLLKPGEYFGSLPVLGDDRYTDSAYAQSTSCILSIGAAEFESVLHAWPSVAVKLIEITSRRLQTAREKIRQFTTSSVEQRIFSVLVTLAEKFGEHRKDGILIQVPLSRQDLANMTGTSSETASRIMSRLQEDRLIETGRQWVKIRNYQALRDRIDK